MSPLCSSFLSRGGGSDELFPPMDLHQWLSWPCDRYKSFFITCLLHFGDFGAAFTEVAKFRSIATKEIQPLKLHLKNP